MRGIKADRENIDNALVIYDDTREELVKQLKELTGLDNPNSQPQFLEWAQAQGYDRDNLQAGTLKEYIENDTN